MADDYYGGLTEAGRALGGGIQQAMQMYHQRHVQQLQADSMMQTLANTNDPVTGKPILDTKSYERYMAHSAADRAHVAGGMEQALKFAGQLNQVQDVLSQRALRDAEARYYDRRSMTSDMAGKPVIDQQTGDQVGVFDEFGKPSYYRREKPQAEEEKPLPPPPEKPGIIQRARDFFYNPKAGASPSATASPSPQAQPGMTVNGDRVRVRMPDGRTGTVPKSQLALLPQGAQVLGQ